MSLPPSLPLSPTPTSASGSNQSDGPREKLGLIARTREYLSLVRFSHTVFALPFAFVSAILAWQKTPFRLTDLAGIVVCMVAARTAAMAFNRLADHKLDAANPRTASRHLPAGVLSRRDVAGLTLFSAALFVAGTCLFLPNRWPVMLAVPVLLWLCGYSFAKRFTSLAHYWLGVALGLAPIAVWLAIAGHIEAAPIWLAAVVVTWVGGFDILYACQDEDYDRSVELYSIPSRFGRSGAFSIARVSHLATVGCLVGFWQAANLGLIFAVGVGLIAALLLVEHLLVSPNDLSRVNAAFFTVNTVISFGILALVVADIAFA